MSTIAALFVSGAGTLIAGLTFFYSRLQAIKTRAVLDSKVGDHEKRIKDLEVDSRQNDKELEQKFFELATKLTESDGRHGVLLTKIDGLEEQMKESREQIQKVYDILVSKKG